MKKILACFAVLAAVGLTSSVASAATACTNYVPPTTAGPTNVMTSVLMTATGCDAGGLNFSLFNVSASPATMTVLLAGVNTSTPGEVDLQFQIGGFNFSLPTSAPDLRLSYKVTGLTTGVDNTFGGSAGTSILETVCDSAGINGGVCVHTPLGTILNGAGGHGSVTFLTPQTEIWIIKDITIQSNYTGSSVLVSDFTNSHETSTVPEPMTLSMMGAGLLGLSLISRRRKKS